MRHFQSFFVLIKQHFQGGVTEPLLFFNPKKQILHGLRVQIFLNRLHQRDDNFDFVLIPASKSKFQYLLNVTINSSCHKQSFFLKRYILIFIL